jgi:micrococcal nuclease
MKKFILLTLFSLSANTLLAASYHGPYEIDIVKVIDGDTILVDAHSWPGTTNRVKVRLSMIDAPEIKSKSKCETSLAYDARNFAIKWLSNGRHSLYNVKLGKYAGRVIGEIYNEKGRGLSDELMKNNLAINYNKNSKNHVWCE